jgi:two-component system, NarL family, response regulator DesR
MPEWGVRPSRLIYVENDPALRGIMGDLLRRQPELDVILISDSPTDVLTSEQATRADVALLDLALGPNALNGIDLGIGLRERNSNIGIVIHSQHPLTHVTRRVPVDLRIGWSFVPKTGDMNIQDLVAVIRSTAQGLSTDPPTSTDKAVTIFDVLDELTPRQRAVMGLTASGLSAPQISKRLGISPDSVRQDLTKCYRALVPEAAEGEDRRTQAVVTYLRLVRDESWDSM